MEFNIVRMHFTRPLHLGQESDSLEAVEQMLCHSDTLFSAICHSWLMLYGKSDLEDMLRKFQQSGENNTKPPFCFSSAFPFVQENEQFNYYFPKPLFPAISTANIDSEYLDSDEVTEKLKPLKDIDWITKEFFEKWLTIDRKDLPENIFQELQTHLCSAKTKSDLLDKQIKTSIRPRVALDPVSSESRLFFFGMTRFLQESGLYFLISWNENYRAKWETKFKAVMRLLGDTGIGGERSSGYGTFDPQWDKIQMNLTDRNGWITLSLWYPNQNELRPGILGQYTLLTRAGWASSPLLQKAYRRKVINMFAEGSTSSKAVNGCLVDVTPNELKNGKDHNIYKYGFAFTLPASLPGR
jgi:CRISPR-associated protein Csm4